MFIHPRTVEAHKLQVLKQEILQYNLPMSMYDIARICMAKYRMEVKLIMHKFKQNENKKFP